LPVCWLDSPRCFVAFASFGIHLNGITLAQGSAASPSLNIATGGANRLSVKSDGNVDLAGKLNIVGQDGLGITGFQPFLTLIDSNTNQRGRIASGGGDLSFYPEGSLHTGTAAMTVKSGGSVGIGTTTPVHRLSVSGGPMWTSNGWAGAMSLSNGSAIGWENNSSGQAVGIGHSDGGLYFFRTASNPGTTGFPANYDLVINDSGNIGQPLSNFGLPKALVYLNRDATIGRCYNGVTGASSGNCGFISTKEDLGGYGVTFNFPVNGRFIVATSLYDNRDTAATIFDFPTANKVRLSITYTDNGDLTDAALNIIVF
jgi:hypothetical protein